MTDARAILATFTDYRPVKSRSVLQIVMEVPIERSKETLDRLGYPMPGETLWCGIARVKEEKLEPARVERPRSRWEDMRPSQQMGIACQDEAFQRWMSAADEDECADMLRVMLSATSRADADTNHAMRTLWKQTYDQFLTETRLPEQRR